MKAPVPPPPPVGADWCFLLDVDGTLVEFAPRPDAVRVAPTTLALLGDLHGAAGGALALVSGRSIADLDRLFAPHRFAAAGQHGAERRGADGRHHTGCDAGVLRASVERLHDAARRHAGMLVEDKGCSIALHYRIVPALAATVRAIAEDECARLGPEYVVLPGKMVFEIRPGLRNKGDAVAAFLGEAPFHARPPVVIGDDVSDEPGFAAANAAGGLSLKVGPGPTVARYRLTDAAAVRRWLAAWIARRRSSRFPAPAGRP